MILYERVLQMGSFPKVSERCLNSSFYILLQCVNLPTPIIVTCPLFQSPSAKINKYMISCLLKAFLLITDYLAG